MKTAGSASHPIFRRRPTLELPRWNMVVEFYVEPLEHQTDNGVYEVVGTDQVRFTRRNATPPSPDLIAGIPNRRIDVADVDAQPLQLTEIMPVVFSEIMRDVDLFVAVCSIGTEPNAGTQAYGNRWHHEAFGDLNNSARTRKQVLEEIIPALKIAARCTFDGKFLKVKGDFRTYKIHLGSGNILMEPNDEYLCIVARRGAQHTRERVFLPFEGDQMISVILSKAMMLAQDTAIKDPSILSQIHRKMPN